MITPNIVIGSTAFICIVLALVFYLNNRKQLRTNLTDVSTLERDIKLHRRQLELRAKGLDNYDFLKYNLNEALIVQMEIILTV